MAWDLEEAIAWHRAAGAPGDQTALIGLLREVQQESGGSIPRPALGRIAEVCGLKDSYLLALIRRIPSLRLSDVHVLELCGGPNCGRARALAALAEDLCAEKAGTVTLRFVPCMRLCGKGPNLRWDGVLYHEAGEALLRRLLS